MLEQLGKVEQEERTGEYYEDDNRDRRDPRQWLTHCMRRGRQAHEVRAWPQLPTETDIYILPDGRVVIADLPAELTSIPSALGVVEACEIAPDAQPDSAL